jgi:two-component system sensor histidine kinase NreB
MKNNLRILILEDNEADAEMIKRLLTKATLDCECQLVAGRDSYITALIEFQPEVILSDNSMPQFSSAEALEIKKELRLQIPFIMVSGTATEEFAASMIRKGADDYLLKDRMARLPAAIEAALKQKKIEREKLDAEKKSEESNNNLKTIFENTSEGFLLMDTDGVIRALNKRAAKYGLLVGEKEIETGDLIFDFITDDMNSVFKESVAKVLQGERVQYERVYRLEDGNDLWIDFLINPVKDDELIKGICVTGRDITEKKRIERDREFDRNNLAALINNTQDLMWSVDRDFKLITCNNSFGKVIKTSSGQPLHKGNNVLETNFGKEQVARFKEYYNRAFKGESFREVECNGIIWSEISFYPIYSKGEIIGTACFSRDITGRKKADAALEATLKELSDYKTALDESSIVSITNPKGVITYVNKNFCEISEYSADELLGKNHSIVNSSFHDKAFFKHLWATILAGKIWRNEVRNKTKNGKYIWVDTTIVPFLNNKGNPTQYVAINRDITEQKSIERELVYQKIQEQKKITRAIMIAEEKERTRLSSELHDNINQLLAGTKLYLGAVGDENPDFKEKIKYPVELIDNSIEEIRLLCHRMGSPIKNIDLSTMVQDLLGNIRENSTIKTDFTFSLPSLVLTDDLKLNIFRIFQEQTNNILKYAKAKNVSISVTEKHTILHIIIKDDGIGFDLKTKRNGIGISNMKHRIESYNGQIEIISSPGNGCTIDIKVPC